MTCAEFEVLLQSLLDDRQPVVVEGAGRAHVRTCPACRELQQAAMLLTSAMAERRLALPDPMFAQRVVGRWQRRQHRGRLIRNVLALAASVAIVGLVLGTWTTWRGAEPQPNPVAHEPTRGEPSPPIGPGTGPLQLAQAPRATIDLGRGFVAEAWDNVSVLVPPMEVSVTAVASPKTAPGLPDLGRSVNDGFEPVAKNAQRAWSAWGRLIPTPKDERRRS